MLGAVHLRLLRLRGNCRLHFKGAKIGVLERVQRIVEIQVHANDAPSVAKPHSLNRKFLMKALWSLVEFVDAQCLLC